MPVAAPPIAMLTLPPAVVHTTEPLTFWFFPSMVTVGPPPALADALPPEVAPPPELDLLLEQPEIAAARIAAPATAIVSSRFTCSPSPDHCGPRIEGRLGSMRVCRAAQKRFGAIASFRLTRQRS